LGKAWPALDIHVPACDPQLQDLVLAELDDFQPTAIQELDEGRKLRAFFPADAARTAAAHALGAAFGRHVFVEPTDIEDEDWTARSQAGLRAVTVGGITVAPPWDVPENVDGSTVPCFVVIKPSMGFGTGHHATTRLMLKALQTIGARDTDVLDIGCGSGVLAIAAARLGARSALGIDIDPDALESARENVELNRAGGLVSLREGDFRLIRTPYSLVFANLTGGLLQRNAKKLANLVAPGGHLIVSGFMDTEAAVMPALEEFLTLRHADHEDEWRSAIFQKRR
jgi:ribosomal protein L11 methyltransferase